MPHHFNEQPHEPHLLWQRVGPPARRRHIGQASKRARHQAVGGVRVDHSAHLTEVGRRQAPLLARELRGRSSCVKVGGGRPRRRARRPAVRSHMGSGQCRGGSLTDRRSGLGRVGQFKQGGAGEWLRVGGEGEPQHGAPSDAERRRGAGPVHRAPPGGCGRGRGLGHSLARGHRRPLSRPRPRPRTTRSRPPAGRRFRWPVRAQPRSRNPARSADNLRLTRCDDGMQH